ncbi:MAG: NAD(P)/FAD-dependent oxidoreductase [Bacteroidales bacterium]
MKQDIFDLIVVGGGAAGVLAAGRAASLGAHVLLLEKMEKPLRKLRISGKGRCNITNIASLEEFSKKINSDYEFLKPSLQQFFNTDIIQLLEKVGLPTITERGGRVFPKSQKAWDVAESLQKWAKMQGVTSICNARVIEITKCQDKSFEVAFSHQGAEYAELSNTLLIATGGASYPATGSTGDGYKFAKLLGHHIIPIRPSLVPLEIEGFQKFSFANFTLRNVKLSLFVNDKEQGAEQGELSFTNFGVSGAIVLRLSRIAVDALQNGKKVEFHLDFKPALSHLQLQNRLQREIEATPDNQSVNELLRKLLPSAIIPFFREKFEIDQNTKISESICNKIILGLKTCKLHIIKTRPFTEAIITAGGVSLDEVNPQTMESKLVEKLYFAGELLDIDAQTGGYNMQLAFSTAWQAGTNIAKTLKRNIYKNL